MIIILTVVKCFQIQILLSILKNYSGFFNKRNEINCLFFFGPMSDCKMALDIVEIESIEVSRVLYVIVILYDDNFYQLVYNIEIIVSYLTYIYLCN